MQSLAMLPTKLITSVAVSFLIGQLHAQTQVSDGTGIVGQIADGTPSKPPVKPELPIFTVKQTIVRQMDVVEAPAMSGLPPVKGRINVTVQLVEDPNLPEPPPPLPALPVDDPAVKARMTEFQGKYRSTELVFVSATVYDHSRTLLKWYPNGDATKEISAWSNLDFNCFSGFANYQVAQADGTIRQYGLIMGIGNENTASRREFREKQGKAEIPVEIPVLPDIATAGPSYIVIGGDTSDASSMAVVQGMHDLYRVEGSRMEMAYQARTRANEERRAYLLAHPPVPKDVSIQFWTRTQAPEPDGQNNATQEEAR